jgi:DNA-binding SARP family transcriptional activator/tetratricopeptide (TPR) repeat protein
MDFRLLGPLEVAEHDHPLALGGAKQRALLAVLLLHANDVVPTERLIDELWGESPPATVAKSIQVYVSRLRKQLGDGRLVTRTPGYVLFVDASELDVARFEGLVAEAGRADPEAAARKLRAALALWRGPPLADLAYEPFARAPIARLEELRLVALEQRIDAELASGRHAELVGELEGLVGEHALRERMRGQLMLALYRSGRQAEALEAYREARRALVEELGIEPGRQLRELHDAILKQDPRLDLVVAAEPSQAPRTVFVGREREIAELVGGLEDAFAGHGRLFLLVGEPGIGKSRLAEELIAHARARGARVLVGRCWEAGGAPAYWPWVQSLRAYVRDSDPCELRSQLGSGAAELAQIVPELRERFPDLPELSSPGSEGARFRMFDASAQFLRNASEGRPIVLVLDDLHAADAPSLLLLQFLARELRSSRLLVLGAYRDVDPIPGQPLTEMLAEVAREPVTRRLSLGGLSGRDVARYVELTSPEIASAGLVTALQEETEGNPLFVGELVRLLWAEGTGPASTDEVRLAIPASVHDVIARRLAHLSQACKRVLGLASAIGREFELDVLARACDASEEELLDSLDEAMAARVLSDVPGAPGRVRFAHVLIRDTLYDALTSVRRIRMHTAVVEALESLCGAQPGPHLAELAHHSMLGSDYGKGLRYGSSAADWALALLAYEEASRLYETALRALELSRPGDERARCKLLLALGEAEARAGNSTAAKKAFLDAADLARRLGLSRDLARAAAGYGGRIIWVRAGADDRLVPLIEEGLAVLPEGDLELRARLLARLAGALRDERTRDRRDALSREAVELARRAGNPDVLAYALSGRGHAIIAPHTVAECLALGSELREVAARSGDRERVVAGYGLRVMAQLMAGHVRETEVDLAAASGIADELRQPVQLWDVCGTRAMLALATGRLDEAEELIPRALALGQRAVPEAAIPIYQLQRYTLADFRGSLEGTEPAIRGVVAEHPTRPVFRCALAHLHARLGRLSEAQGALERLTRHDCAALPFDQEWLYGMSLLAETCALLGDTGSAAGLHRLLVPWATFNAADTAEGMRGSVSRYLGLLATTLKRWREAERHFEDALEKNASMGARPWLAHTQADYARMLLARDDTSDRERALELLADAVATYRELGMESWAKAASELNQALRARAPRHRP